MSDETGLDALAEALRGKENAEQMLGFVLLALGEPVVVPKQILRDGIPAGAQIKIDEHVDEDTFVFSVEADIEQ